MLAARHGQDHLRLGTNRAVERGVGRRVAGVQADDEIDAGEVGLGDVAELEAQAVRAEPAGERLALRDDVRLQVEAERARPRGRGRASAGRGART